MGNRIRAEVWECHGSGAIKLFVWGARTKLPVFGASYATDDMIDRLIPDYYETVFGRWSPECDNGSELPDHECLKDLHDDYRDVVRVSEEWCGGHAGSERGWTLGMSTIEDVPPEDLGDSTRSALQKYHLAQAAKFDVDA